MSIEIMNIGESKLVFVSYLMLAQLAKNIVLW